MHLAAHPCFSLTVLPSYEVTSTKYTRDIYKELLISLVASLFMGFGVLFLLLWVGIYV
jgi:ABC-type dipeptide/oligopeptide/nickel transport system permease subunit